MTYKVLHQPEPRITKIRNGTHRKKRQHQGGRKHTYTNKTQQPDPLASKGIDVLNLSDVELSGDQTEVLLLALNFVPCQDFDIFTTIKDINKCIRSLLLVGKPCDGLGGGIVSIFS